MTVTSPTIPLPHEDPDRDPPKEPEYQLLPELEHPLADPSTGFQRVIDLNAQERVVDLGKRDRVIGLSR